MQVEPKPLGFVTPLITALHEGPLFCTSSHLCGWSQVACRRCFQLTKAERRQDAVYLHPRHLGCCSKSAKLITARRRTVSRCPQAFRRYPRCSERLFKKHFNIGVIRIDNCGQFGSAVLAFQVYLFLSSIELNKSEIKCNFRKHDLKTVRYDTMHDLH